jgi:hypothetical protein
MVREGERTTTAVVPLVHDGRAVGALLLRLREAFDEALLAADAAMGMSSRLANAIAAPQPGQPQQQVRPQRTQQPYAHASW